MNKSMPLILIVLSIGIFFFLIDPQYKEIKVLLDEKAENDRMLDLANELREKRDELQDKFNNISTEEKEKLEKLLPDTVDNVRLVLDISNIAEEYGITIRDISVEGDSSGDSSSSRTPSSPGSVGRSGAVVNNGTDNIGEIQLSFSVSASYDDFKDFLLDLEESLRLVDVTDFSVSLGNDELYDYSITISTYWLR